MNENANQSKTPYLLLLLAMAVGTVFGVMVSKNPILGNNEDENLLGYKVRETMNLIENCYVDEISGDSLTNEMLNAMLTYLDPHSHYLSAEEMARESEQLQGHFDGIGVVLRRVGDTSCVNQIIEGGPSMGAGLLPGDRIVSVDTVPVVKRKVSADGVVKLIRGRKGTTVDLGIVRRGVEGVGHYKIKRGTVSTPSVTYSDMVDKTTGYIRISRFAEQTPDEFVVALLMLKDKGMKRLVIDLRGNGGGLLESALLIADQLLPKGHLIVYTEGVHQARADVHSTRGGHYTEGDLVVLIDEYSASASEILAGAIQDNDRGLIMGRRSFGKGLVQGQFNLADGSAIWLTTARYYTPSGRCIQKPYDNGFDEYYLSNYEQILSESMSDSIDAQLNDTTKYYTKKGRVVYGGGGIVPDKVIPHKRYDDIVYFNQLSRGGVLIDYAFEYVSGHIAELNRKYPSAMAFERLFEVSDLMVEELAKMGEARGIARNAKSIAAYRSLMKSTLKAYIGQSLFNDHLYYKLLLADDDELQQVLKTKM